MECIKMYLKVAHGYANLISYIALEDVIIWTIAIFLNYESILMKMI